LREASIITDIGKPIALLSSIPDPPKWEELQAKWQLAIENDPAAGVVPLSDWGDLD